MSPITWKQVKDSLCKMSTPVTPAPAGEFWVDFKARARLHPQHVPANDAVPRLVVFRWALAAASVLVLGGLFLSGHILRPGGSGEPGTTIKSLEVVASHSAVLIMNDDKQRATILWIADMDSDADADDDDADNGDRT